MHIQTLNEWASTQGKSYTYVIDLNERGEFRAHVDDPDGDTVFIITSEDSTGGELWIIEDGYMKHVKDIDGLREYLIELGVMSENDDLSLGQ